MFIHSHAIKICTQKLNCTKTAKDKPYFYEVVDPRIINWADWTQDELDHLYSEAQKITTIIEAETFRRLDEKRS
jgi:hypothetical protein